MQGSQGLVPEVAESLSLHSISQHNNKSRSEITDEITERVWGQEGIKILDYFYKQSTTNESDKQ